MLSLINKKYHVGGHKLSFVVYFIKNGLQRVIFIIRITSTPFLVLCLFISFVFIFRRCSWQARPDNRVAEKRLFPGAPFTSLLFSVSSLSFSLWDCASGVAEWWRCRAAIIYWHNLSHLFCRVADFPPPRQWLPEAEKGLDGPRQVVPKAALIGVKAHQSILSQLTFLMLGPITRTRTGKEEKKWLRPSK